jgi:hypothetical protein
VQSLTTDKGCVDGVRWTSHHDLIIFNPKRNPNFPMNDDEHACTPQRSGPHTGTSVLNAAAAGQLSPRCCSKQPARLHGVCGHNKTACLLGDLSRSFCALSAVAARFHGCRCWRPQLLASAICKSRSPRSLPSRCRH